MFSNRFLSACAIVSLGFLFSAPASWSQNAGVFAGLTGSWRGNGTVRLVGGPQERIRCRATYHVSGGGTTLHQTLRCASDSYRFDLSGEVHAQGGQLSGSWSETSRNVQGVLFGQASPGRYQVNVTGPGFLANLSLTTHGDRQSVTINAQGAQPAGAAISLTRTR